MNTKKSKCPSHGMIGLGNLQPLDCSVCAEIVRDENMNTKTKNEIRDEFRSMFEREWSEKAENYLIQKLEEKKKEIINKAFNWIWGRWNLDFSNIDKAKKDFINSLTKEE